MDLIFFFFPSCGCEEDIWAGRVNNGASSASVKRSRKPPSLLLATDIVSGIVPKTSCFDGEEFMWEGKSGICGHSESLIAFEEGRESGNQRRVSF